MKLQISYYPSDDILLMQNGCSWAWGGDVASGVIVYSDAGHNPVAIEVSGAAKLLRPLLKAGQPKAAPRECGASESRPDEDALDRVCLPLTISYDEEVDAMTLECGLPTPFGIAIADGLTAFYDGEDEYGKYINAVRLENAAKLLKPHLAP